MSQLKDDIADLRQWIEALPDKPSTFAARVERVVVACEKMEAALEEWSKYETVTAPDGRRWPLGVHARSVLKEVRGE